MKPLVEVYLQNTQKLGWNKELVEALIKMTGGYDDFASQALEAGELIFINSLSSRPDLIWDEPTTTTATSVLAHVAALDESNADVLADLFDTHQEAIKASLLAYLGLVKPDAIDEFIHLTHEMTDDEVSDYFKCNIISHECKRYVVATTYYCMAMILVDMAGGLNSGRLRDLDLSKVTQISCKDAKVVATSKATKKLNGFTGCDESLDTIVKQNTLDLLFNNEGSKRHISYISITGNESLFNAVPINIICGQIDYIDAKGEAFLIADIENKKDHVTIRCDDNGVCDIHVSVKGDFDIEVSNNAQLILSGQSSSCEIKLHDNSSLLAARFESPNMNVTCNDDCTAIANSKNFFNNSTTNEINASVINMSVVPEDQGYLNYCQMLRDQGSHDGTPDYHFYTRKNRDDNQEDAT